MSIIGLFIALALMGLGLSWHQKSGFHKKIFMVVVAVMVLLGILAGVGEVIARFEGLSGEMENSGARLDVWKDSVKMIRDYPWFGVGAGNFSLLFHKYNSVVDSLFYDHVHNDYLEILVEGGLVGAIYFAMVGLRFLKKEQDSSRWTIVLGGMAGLLAITLHGITDFNMQIPANAMMFFFLLGLTYRIMEFKGDRVKMKVRRGHGRKRGS